MKYIRIGNDVALVYRELIKLGDFLKADDIGSEKASGNIFDRVIDIISGIFQPIIPVIAAVIITAIFCPMVTWWTIKKWGSAKITKESVTQNIDS